ncbi:hypothetical protein [Streptomyces sp. NBC_01497]|uniref:hypothetical protein n=1 Tax=Streptomyces sp. NBC_01497 TaxID=2903885 RepID=UPI002E31F249|nr:hypothetical protein [Streptomyces sp. NBC_01497]
MANSVDAGEADESHEDGNEVEAHAATPVELQEMGVRDPRNGADGVIGSSIVSLAAC